MRVGGKSVKMGEGIRGGTYEDILNARFDAARDCELERPAR